MNYHLSSLGGPQLAARRQTPRTGVFWTNILMLAYGAGPAFTVPLIGQLYGSELIALVFVPFVGWQSTFRRYRSLRVLIAGYIVLLIGLVVSDLVNGTATVDSLRGWANPIFAIASTLFVTSVLRRNINATVSLLFGTFLAMLIFGSANYAIQYGYAELSAAAVEQNSNMFKIRFVPFLIPALQLLCIFSYRLGMIYSIAIYSVAAVFFIGLDARSAGLELLISSALLGINLYRIRISTRMIFLIGLPLLLAGQYAYIAYIDYSLKSNPNGQTTRQLAKLDDPYNPLELLMQGRAEWTIAADAISAKPIFGHGSWALDVDDNYNMLLADRTRGLDDYLRLSSI